MGIDSYFILHTSYFNWLLNSAVISGRARSHAHLVEEGECDLLAHGDTEQAAVELGKGFEIDENLRNSRGLGMITPDLTYALVQLGRRDEALAYCQRAITVAPNKPRLMKLRDRLN